MPRRFQFSLKTLLVLITAVCVSFWIAALDCDDSLQWLLVTFLVVNVIGILYD